MESSCAESGMMNSDFSQLTADGTSNAIGSMQEFEVLTALLRSSKRALGR
jgi:hypothetical protein